MDAEAAEATEGGSFLGVSVFLILRRILGCFGMDCIHRLHYGRLVGGFPSEEMLNRIGSLRFAQRNYIFYALAGIMGEIGLLLAGWDEWTGWDGGGTGMGWRDRR